MNEVNMNESYALYSNAPGLFGMPVGAMLICENCAGTILTPETFADDSPLPERPPLEDVWGNIEWRQKMNVRSIASLCKQRGLSPAEAKQKARSLAGDFFRNKSSGELATKRFWQG
jgi:hypothetical protein